MDIAWDFLGGTHHPNPGAWPESTREEPEEPRPRSSPQNTSPVSLKSIIVTKDKRRLHKLENQIAKHDLGLAPILEEKRIPRKTLLRQLAKLEYGLSTR